MQLGDKKNFKRAETLRDGYKEKGKEKKKMQKERATDREIKEV